MNKRGQFFLVAALVIIGILISLRVVYNVAKSPEEDFLVYDLSDEIDFESSKVIDSGVFMGIEPPTTILNNIDALSMDYSDNNPNSKLAFIYGDATKVNVIYYKPEPIGSISLVVGGAVMEIQTISVKKEVGNVEPGKEGSEISVNLPGETKRKFNLKPGQNFYIVIEKQREEGEKIVASS